MLTKEQKEALLKLARDSIQAEFSKERIDLPDDPLFYKKRGIFVSLHKGKELRGCIGFPMPAYTVSQGIVRAAKSAAFEDPRFEPLEESELEKLKIEISVLSMPEEIKVSKPEEYEERIVIGEDGLLLRTPYTSGLLLPQVFTEYRCTPKQALEMTCQKAGLHKDAWHDLSIKIYKFQAEIFSEKKSRKKKEATA